MKRKKVAKEWYQYYDEPWSTQQELEKREKKLNKVLNQKT